MDDCARAGAIRAIIRRLEALQPNCARRLVRVAELEEAIASAEAEAEAILDRESTAGRLFQRMRSESAVWWPGADEWVADDGCRHLESRIRMFTAVLKELAPDIGTPEELNADLIREIEAQKSLMVAVATGGPRINDVNLEYRQRAERIRSQLQLRGIENPNPYADLWQWYGKWSSGDLPTYRSRREYIRELYAPTLDALRRQAPHEPARAFTEPTGWAKIDRNLGKARVQLEQARTEIDFQQVGLICRETLIDLAQAVFIPDRHPWTDEVEASQTDAKRMLDAYLSTELGGHWNENARRHAKAALALANELTHKRTATFRDAALCVEATASVVNIIAIISGRRDPPPDGSG